MSTTITIDPVTRIEGHLRVDAVVDDGLVKEANCSGTLFRGFEIFLKGRDPVDAARLTQRVCGVCPTAHATASALALDEALGVADSIPDNGRIVRNLILAGNILQSHVLHFYALAALDYVDVTACADYEGPCEALKSVKNFIAHGALGPFVPRYEGDYRLSKEANQACTAHYVQALQIRQLAHELVAIFGGKMPHNVATIPGGVTCDVTLDKIVQYRAKLDEIRKFVENVYIPDVLAVAGAYSDYFGIGAGCKQLLTYGGLDLEAKAGDPTQRQRFFQSGVVTSDLQLQPIDTTKISEDVKHSWFADDCASAPANGSTVPDKKKEGAYSWLKSPRYDGQVAEVGPLARMGALYLAGMPAAKTALDGAMSAAGIEPSALFSVLGRHAARALEAKLVADAAGEWLGELKPGEPAAAPYQIPDEGEGMGLTDAPRGAVGHWIKVKDKKIENYQLVVPTTWNCSPKDAQGQPGPVEQALMGTPIKDTENPFEIVRIVRSFDPCLACSIHVINAKGRELGQFQIA